MLGFDRTFVTILLMVITLTSAACAAESTPQQLPTFAPTRPVAGTSAGLPTETPPIPALSTSVASNCVDDAIFVEDVTIPDFSPVEPGEILDKRWTVQNTGTCNWGPGYRLVRLGADEFMGPTELALFPARAGSAVDLRVELTAPDEPGEYISRWQTYSASGVPFGQEIYLLIRIPTPTPEPTRTPRDS